MLNKDVIVKLLMENDKAVARALVVLHNNQTNDEQRHEATINRNGSGFRPCHARMGSSMATFYLAKGYLSAKQVAYWRKPMADGNSKIGIYWRQLAEAAEAKQSAKPVSDVGNMSEELMVLEETNDGSKAMQERIALLKKEIARAYNAMESK